jgi:hypothetical protein
MSGGKQPECLAERRQRLEKSLESGLGDTFSASGAINVVLPARNRPDQKTAPGGT